MLYILYINLKNLDWPMQNMLPNGLAITQKPQAIFITGMSDFAQIALVQDLVSDGCEVTVEIADEVSGELPAWVNRVSFSSLYLSSQRRLGSIGPQKKSKLTKFSALPNLYMDPSLRWDDSIRERVINADYTIDNRLSWPTHQAALEKLLPHIQHLSIYGLQRHDIKQALQAWFAAQGWGFYDAFHAKPLAAQSCRFLEESYDLQMPLLGVGAGAYSRWLIDDQWFERKLNAKGNGVWHKLTTK